MQVVGFFFSITVLSKIAIIKKKIKNEPRPILFSLKLKHLWLKLVQGFCLGLICKGM